MKYSTFFSRSFKWTAISSLMLAAVALVSCTTTYDAYGRPVQSVDPGVAVAGAAAAGLAGYAIARDRDDDRHYYHHRPYYRSGYYGPRYYGPRNYYYR